jgi:ABC-2 type transport system ATP-binding protein
VSNPRARAKLGFLPENPYVYPYLTPREFVTLSARLAGLGYSAARARTRYVLEQLGIAYAGDRSVRRLSKGMLQRTGIAAALVADPELLMLDEPMSGLDPVGRKEVRDLILAERSAGRTIFFSTHILSDVETLCDQVAILRRGEVVVRGALRDLLKRDVKRTDVTFLGADQALDEYCNAHGHVYQRLRERLVVEVLGEQPLQSLLQYAASNAVTIAEVIPRHETLEELFVREAIDH